MAYIFTAVVHSFVDEKILLLGADGGTHHRHVLVAEQMQNAQHLLVQRLHRAEQGGFFVQRLTAVGTAPIFYILPSPYGKDRNREHPTQFLLHLGKTHDPLPRSQSNS